MSIKTLAVGHSPRALAIGDLNGDGVPDVVAANLASNNLSLLLSGPAGGGAALTRAAIDPVVGLRPFAVALADLNGDGASDIVTANYGDNTVTVMTGKGDGTFTRTSNPHVGARPYSVAVADLNGDGIKDIVTANASSDTVSVLLGRAGANGKATGAFAPATSGAVGSDPYSVAIGDVDGDGVPDIVTANSGDDSVSVLHGKGDGTFALTGVQAVGSGPYSVSIGDLNGDGVKDIVTANFNRNAVSVLLGTGHGGFAPAVSYDVRSTPLAATIADVNGDGIPDIVTSHIGSNSVTELLGRGDGTFAPATPKIYVGSGPYAVAAGDLDGDGTADIATANLNDNTVSLLLSRTTQADSGSPAPTPQSPGGPSAGGSTPAGSGPISPSPDNAVAANFVVADLSRNMTSTTAGEHYTGSASDIAVQYVDATSDNLNVTAITDSVFVQTKGGMDGVQVHGGRNIVDGGTGSSFLIGGSGTDTFLVDGRQAVTDRWSTIVGFHGGDSVTLLGVDPTAFRLDWADDQGTAPATGLTLHAFARDGSAPVSLTLAGLHMSDLSNGTLTVAYDTTGSASMQIVAHS